MNAREISVTITLCATTLTAVSYVLVTLVIVAMEFHAQVLNSCISYNLSLPRCRREYQHQTIHFKEDLSKTETMKRFQKINNRIM